MSSYHVEAAIAATHGSAPSVDDTDWPAIVSLFDTLMNVAPSLGVELNRAIAISESDGAERGLALLHKITNPERLSEYPFYTAAMGELELRRGDKAAAAAHFRAALAVARNAAERRRLEKRLQHCAE